MIQNRTTLFSRIHSSIFWSPIFPQNERERKKFLLNNLISCISVHERFLPEQALKFTHTWGLGGIGVILVMLLFLTGILLKFIYEPFPGRAYDSIILLQQDVWCGQFIRNIHHWSANFLVIAVFLHMLRVFFTGAFHPPRQFNWIIGLILFFLFLYQTLPDIFCPGTSLHSGQLQSAQACLNIFPVQECGCKN